MARLSYRALREAALAMSKCDAVEYLIEEMQCRDRAASAARTRARERSKTQAKKAHQRGYLGYRL
ncbi:MAG TPA: hypothetical protein PLP01_16250 [Phycisphaerae bacterium]|nr:hypothetical protein [Phycisphaerae bacterium]HOI56802.1 hypothetical protein [Phycisphaerae bacterium]